MIDYAKMNLKLLYGHFRIIIIFLTYTFIQWILLNIFIFLLFTLKITDNIKCRVLYKYEIKSCAINQKNRMKLLKFFSQSSRKVIFFNKKVLSSWQTSMKLSYTLIILDLLNDEGAWDLFLIYEQKGSSNLMRSPSKLPFCSNLLS